MSQQHPITPSPELVNKIFGDALRGSDGQHDYELRLIHAAYAAGADQELEACCKWLPKLPPWSGNDLRKHRRPKPPTLKERALHELHDVYSRDKIDDSTYDTILKALETLND